MGEWIPYGARLAILIVDWLQIIATFIINLFLNKINLPFSIVSIKYIKISAIKTHARSHRTVSQEAKYEHAS